MAKTRVSLVDIARRTGYSVMTVSYALRNHPKIKESTRTKIRATADEMGYAPDPNIVKLMSRIRMNQKVEPRSFVAVLDLFEDRHRFTVDPYTNTMVSAAGERLSKLGYQMTRFRVFEPGMNARRLATILTSRGIEGVILPPFPTGMTDFEMDWSSITAICTEEKFHEPALNKVIPHHYSNMTLALQQLWDMGYRRPGLASCANSLGRDNYAWFGAFYSFLLDRQGGEVIPPLPVANDPREMVQWFETHRPDVIIVTEGWLIDAFQTACGVKIPDDVGAVSISADIGTLSGIIQGADVIGSAAADILTAHIIRNERGVPANPKTMMIEGKWVDRGTVRAMSESPCQKTRRKNPRNSRAGARLKRAG